MNKNLTITKLVLGITVAALVSSPAFAAQKKSPSIHKTFNRAAPGQMVPFSVSPAGLYHNDVLPGGTITGPLGPNANGG